MQSRLEVDCDEKLRGVWEKKRCKLFDDLVKMSSASKN